MMTSGPDNAASSSSRCHNINVLHLDISDFHHLAEVEVVESGDLPVGVLLLQFGDDAASYKTGGTSHRDVGSLTSPSALLGRTVAVARRGDKTTRSARSGGGSCLSL